MQPAAIRRIRESNGARHDAGGGGHDIHFGIYRDEDYGVKEAAAATTEFMLLNMDWAKKVRPTDRVSFQLGK